MNRGEEFAGKGDGMKKRRSKPLDKSARGNLSYYERYQEYSVRIHNAYDTLWVFFVILVLPMSHCHGYSLEVHRETSGLNGNATLLLILAGVGETSITSASVGNNTSAAHEGVGEGSLAVVDVRNHGHGPDVVLEVHDGAQLINSKVHLINKEDKKSMLKWPKEFTRAWRRKLDTGLACRWRYNRFQTSDSFMVRFKKRDGRVRAHENECVDIMKQKR